MRFETTGYKVLLYIDKIRSSVSISVNSDLTVTLAMENFQHNTEGQCGVCAGASCVRRDGTVEDDTCCGLTSLSWVYEDPAKPYCKPKDLPCTLPTPNPTHSPSPCSPDPVGAKLCDIIDGSAFAECRKMVDLSHIRQSCKADLCLMKNNTGLTYLCSVLSKAAEECNARNICVEWRHLTNGVCDFSCDQGMVFQECRDHADDYCEAG
nr:mucin-2-like [Paramormyrops kingsleyae]